MAIIAAGGTDLYCHSEPPLTSGKLCFIINLIGVTGGRIFTGGRPPDSPLNRPCAELKMTATKYGAEETAHRATVQREMRRRTNVRELSDDFVVKSLVMTRLCRAVNM